MDDMPSGQAARGPGQTRINPAEVEPTSIIILKKHLAVLYIALSTSGYLGSVFSGKRTAFIQRFSTWQTLLTILPNIHQFMHTDSGVNQARRQPFRQGAGYR